MYEEEEIITEDEENLFGQPKKAGSFYDDEEDAEVVDEDADLEDFGGSYGFQQGPDEEHESEVGELN